VPVQEQGTAIYVLILGVDVGFDFGFREIHKDMFSGQGRYGNRSTFEVV